MKPLDSPLVLVDGPSDVAPDRVPSLDDEEPVATYQAWRREDTRIITVRIGNDVYQGERFESRSEAIAAITARYGTILVANFVPGRCFFRVRKQ